MPAMNRFLLLAAVAPMFTSVLSSQPASIQPSSLRCEYRVNPLGIDVVKPRLTWVLSPSDPAARGLKQSAYRVLVAGSEELLNSGNGDLWDSGKLASEQSIHIVYAGKPLESGRRVWWKVQVWDQAGRASGWSEAAYWSMGLLKAADWKAKWIGIDETAPLRSRSSPFWNLQRARWIWSADSAPGARYFRARFSVPAGRPVQRAICVIAADNEYELFVNGDRAGKGTFVQMPDVIDIGNSIHSGENVLAITARHGDAKKPAGLIVAVRVEFASGEPMVFETSGQWKTAAAAPGEWPLASFNDSAWALVKDLGAYGTAPWGEVGFAEERVLPARMLRKEFDVKAGLRRATAYVSGLGLFELSLNGSKVGDHVLSPGLTDYERRVQYVTLDVTRQLASGRNALGVMLGNGRFHAPRAKVPIAMRDFGAPRLLLQLVLEYADGSSATIGSDESWKATTRGPIRANNEFDGEEYDARMEMPDWDRAGFSEAGWEPAAPMSGPKGVLVAEMAEPLRVMETVNPVSVSRLGAGRYVFDMGQNLVGWCRLKVFGPKGTRVFLRHSETLTPRGMLYVDNLRSARATDVYTLKGDGTEIYEPRFTYHGFRYVEVTGYPGEPKADALEAHVVHDAMMSAGEWTSSNPLLNRIQKNIYWGVRGNYRSIPTDCPQRDERQGWLGDRSVVSRSESYLYDIGAFYTKWMTDLNDAQRPAGSIPDVAPAYWVLYNDNMTWPATFALVPGMLYDQYGDVRVIERHYGAMKKWITYMGGFLKDDLMPKDTYGDWCVPPESPELIHSKDPARKTDGTLIGSAYYYEMLKVMSRYGKLLGKKQDVADYDVLAERIKAAFTKKFFRGDAMQYHNGTQTSSILPLAFRLAPEESRNAIFDRLIGKIQTESKNHIGVGLVGAQWLMRTLSDNGRPDVAYTIATQTSYPGWGYMIEKGATTVWELWNGDTADPAMNSGNHVMQIGDLNVWLFEYLAGIRPDPERPGFHHVIVRPYPVGDLTFVKAIHRSMYGEIATEWKRETDGFALNVTIPANTTATVYVPATAQTGVTESGQPAAHSTGVKFVGMEGNRAIFEVESGTYRFRSAL